MRRQDSETYTLAYQGSDVGTIRSVDFLVPPGTEAVTVEIIDGPLAPTVIDLGIKDPHRIRGWSGGTRQSATVGWQTATPGYLSGPISSGRWSALLGLYHIPSQGLSLTLRVVKHLWEPDWKPGDLHAHTIHSDGAWTPEELLERARRAGLEFLALTDHNTVSQNFAAPSHAASITVLPGMEWTTYHGHANIWGLPDPLPNWRVDNANDMKTKRDRVLQEGAMVSINHPFDQFRSGIAWEWDMEGFPVMEIWNGPWRPANQQALEWWTSALAEGRHITAVGGSDVHGPSELVTLAHPCTWIWCRSPGPQGILEGLRNGHVYITDAPNSLRLLAPSTLPGSVLMENATAIAEIEGLNPGDQVRWYSDTQVVQEWIATESRGHITAHRGDAPFLRLEVRYFHPEWKVWLPRLIANPIHFRGDPHE